MEILIILFFFLVLIGYVFMTINIVKSKKKIHWANLIAMFFFPFLWPFLYFFLKMYERKI